MYEVALECEDKLRDIFSQYNCDSDIFNIEDLQKREFIEEFVIQIHAEKDVDMNEKATDNMDDARRWTKERWEKTMDESCVLVMIG